MTFAALVSMPRATFYARLRGMTANDLRNLLRELQRSLASYAKAFPKDDDTQMRALTLLRRVEKTLHKEFVRYHKPQILRSEPRMSPQTLKWKIAQAWSQFWKQTAY